MKHLALLVGLIMGMVINANGAEIITGITTVNGNTMITCAPGGGGQVEKAYISLYSSGDQELNINRREMDVSYENIASFELPGTHETLEGKCKLIMTGSEITVAREEFTLSMR